VLIAEKTLPGTFVKIHITNSKPFKTSDLYGVVYKVIKIKFEQFHSYQYNLQALRGDKSCLVYSIDHQIDVDYSIEHQTSVVYSMDTSNLCCLQY
jgi:hypothetical protein